MDSSIVDFLIGFYLNEPCRICGKYLIKSDAPTIVWAGYSKNNEARSAHGKCWNENKPEIEWVYQ